MAKLRPKIRRTKKRKHIRRRHRTHKKGGDLLSSYSASTNSSVKRKINGMTGNRTHRRKRHI